MEYVPISVHGVVGKSKTVIVPTAMLQVDPEVERSVKNNIAEDETVFNVKTYPGGEPRTLRVTMKSVKIQKGGSTKSKADFSADLLVLLNSSIPNRFTLQLRKKHSEDFVAANNVERDVIALTIRSFLGMNLLSREGAGLHTVKSLTKVRSMMGASPSSSNIGK